VGAGENATPNENTILARPGYAVAGINVNGEQHVRGIQIIFARQSEGRFDLLDTYESDWLGLPPNRPAVRLGGTGQRVIGIHGRKGLILDAIGLVLEAL
jgi:hypothetical protein